MKVSNFGTNPLLQTKKGIISLTVNPLMLLFKNLNKTLKPGCSRAIIKVLILKAPILIISDNKADVLNPLKLAINPLIPLPLGKQKPGFIKVLSTLAIALNRY
ncbi:MAG: hypothetical protein H0A76_05770 [Candidatus Thiodubiliella endoseptemdiera]|uniref:Uncharacterized protein n=1 Tax=Candidatus Thiodubiliella endoseptemdiera TaxID=2738886 RepID=A0A853F1K7_9GAMM|nr:hypothetical protein [Candidatus Thiodubiliella endoseptemdiera]